MRRELTLWGELQLGDNPETAADNSGCPGWLDAKGGSVVRPASMQRLDRCKPYTETTMRAVCGAAMRRRQFAVAAIACRLLLAIAAERAKAVGCAFEPQGEGRVVAVIDGRTFRLDDGREVRLAGIEPVAGDNANGTSALSSIVADREVTLRGEDDTPDRYGRQSAFVFVSSSETPVQAVLLSRGQALVSAAMNDKDCASVLDSAEAVGREAKRG